MSKVAYVNFGGQRKAGHREVKVSENKRAGFTVTWRPLFDADWASDVYLLAAWMRLINSASYEDTRVSYKGKQWDLVRGQVFVNRAKFAEQLKDRSGHPISKQAVTRMFEWFEKEGMVSLESTAWGYIVTIANYDDYQSVTDKGPKTTVTPVTPPGTPPGTPPVTPDTPSKASAGADLKGVESHSPVTPPGTPPVTPGGTTTEQQVKPVKPKTKRSCPEPAGASSGQEVASDGHPAVIELPLNTGEPYPVTEAFAAQMATLYPAVNVAQELRAMLGWLLTNPAKRKTRRGVERFINSWLQRCQDRGGSSGMAPGRKESEREYWERAQADTSWADDLGV